MKKSYYIGGSTEGIQKLFLFLNRHGFSEAETWKGRMHLAQGGKVDVVHVPDELIAHVRDVVASDTSGEFGLQISVDVYDGCISPEKLSQTDSKPKKDLTELKKLGEETVRRARAVGFQP